MDIQTCHSIDVNRLQGCSQLKSQNILSYYNFGQNTDRAILYFQPDQKFEKKMNFKLNFLFHVILGHITQ